PTPLLPRLPAQDVRSRSRSAARASSRRSARGPARASCRLADGTRATPSAEHRSRACRRSPTRDVRAPLAACRRDRARDGRLSAWSAWERCSEQRLITDECGKRKRRGAFGIARTAEQLRGALANGVEDLGLLLEDAAPRPRQADLRHEIDALEAVRELADVLRVETALVAQHLRDVTEQIAER